MGVPRSEAYRFDLDGRIDESEPAHPLGDRAKRRFEPRGSRCALP